MFTDSECLHAFIKDAAQSITCTPIKPNNIIHMNNDFGFCNECIKYMIPYEELDYIPNAPLINFSVYNYQGICAKHGIIPNGQYSWKISEKYDDIMNGIIKRPTYGKKKYNMKMSCSIGKVHMIHYQPILKKYAYHRMLIYSLGKQECKKLIIKVFLLKLIILW